MADIYEQMKDLSPEKRELLELMLREKGVDVPGSKLVPLGRETNKFQLSFGQQRLWFLDQLEPGSPLYNNPAAVMLKGELNISAMEKALNEIVQRHEVLRTTFTTEDDQPTQVINAEMPIKLERIDLRHLPESERQSEAMGLAKAEAQKPFNLSTDPLFRVTLVQFADQEYLMILVMHHIVSDGWSLSIFIQEIAILYKVHVSGHGSPLPDLAVQYADFAHWQRQWMQGKVLEDQLSYWQEQLKGVPPVLNLPLDRPRPNYQTTNGTTYFFDFPNHLQEAIHTLAKQEDVTLYMISLAAFAALLSRYSNQDDFCVGTPIAGRNRRETESLIGFFVNTLVMRTDLSGNPTVLELLKRVKEVALGAYGHQDIPFETLVEKLQPERDMSISPFFQVMFVHLDTTSQSIKLPDITIEPWQIDSGTAKFDLAFVIEESEQKLAGQIVYNTDLFNSSTIELMAKHFQVLLESFVKDVNQHISEFSVLTGQEQSLLIEKWNKSSKDFHKPQDRCINQLFEAQAEKTPDGVALVYEQEKLSYQELNARANQLAHHLVNCGVTPEVMVGICLDSPMDMITSLLAIFKAGGAYLPLDPTYPKERLAYMIEDSALPVIITEERMLEFLPENQNLKICLSRDRDTISQLSAANPINGAIIENLAYVIYTSGSTGKPKGVLVSHGAIADHCLNMKEYYELKMTDHVLQFASMNFDASLEQILPTLISGATLVLRGNEIWSPEDFLKKIKDHGLTVVNPPTAYWNQLLHESDESALKIENEHLRLFIVGGDTMSTENLQIWEKSSFNTTKLINAYGPTEAIITSTTFEVPDNYDSQALSHSIPIGRPTSLRFIYVVDQHCNPVPIGVPGELYIGGDCLARGYLNRSDLTAEKFIPDPFSKKMGSRLYRTGDLCRFLPEGNIEFLGRIDQQVKVRGYRIELGEIESIINKHPKIKESVVDARIFERADKRLVAYIVADPDFNSVELRNYLQELMPDYMIPSVFVTLDELPRTPIGKINRRELPEPDQLRPDVFTQFVAPRTPTEEKLSKIVMDTLKIDKVGVHDNFFDLGGHSMLATQVVSRIRNVFHVDISLRSLFEKPTIEGIAQSIAEIQIQEQDDEELDQLLSELEGLSDEEVQEQLDNSDETGEDNGFEQCIQPLAPPRNALEKYLVDTWKKVLNIEQVGIYDNFFELGGNETLAANLIEILEEEFNMTAPPGGIYQAPRIVDIAMSMLEYYPQNVKYKLGEIDGIKEKYEINIKGAKNETIDSSTIEKFRNLIHPLEPVENRDIKLTPKNPKAVFVLSPPRSGSTLFRIMLAGNSKLFSPPELDLLSFNTLVERQQFFKQTGFLIWLEALVRVVMEIKGYDVKQAEKILEGLEQKKLSIKEFYALLQSWMGDRLLVDKTPSYSLDSEILTRAEMDFDQPFYIYLMRHPYAMIYSFIEAQLDQHFFKYKHSFSRRELAELIWLVSHQNIMTFLEDIPADRKYRLKFEDLVTNPQIEITKLCTFLNIEFQKEMIEPYKGNKMTDGAKPGSQMVGDFKFYLRNAIDPGVADRWQKFHKQDFLSDISKNVAAELGYDV